nr:PREDICTED: uncharacterized protein LOC102347492 isoform X1 [Latimeria chalumnae]|eukprot:XP_006010438.1 PREDICTED: uncharacterized protein LOC102347492 isoform X1 [Latimeria chalumnae]
MDSSEDSSPWDSPLNSIREATPKTEGRSAEKAELKFKPGSGRKEPVEENISEKSRGAKFVSQDKEAEAKFEVKLLQTHTSERGGVMQNPSPDSLWLYIKPDSTKPLAASVKDPPVGETDVPSTVMKTGVDTKAIYEDFKKAITDKHSTRKPSHPAGKNYKELLYVPTNPSSQLKDEETSLSHKEPQPVIKERQSSLKGQGTETIPLCTNDADNKRDTENFVLKERVSNFLPNVRRDSNTRLSSSLSTQCLLSSKERSLWSDGEELKEEANPTTPPVSTNGEFVSGKCGFNMDAKYLEPNASKNQMQSGTVPNVVFYKDEQ